MWKWIIGLMLLTGNVFADSTVDLINDLTSSKQESSQQEDAGEVRGHGLEGSEGLRIIRKNAYGNGCGLKPFMNLPVGCYLSCIDDEWVKVCN